MAATVDDAYLYSTLASKNHLAYWIYFGYSTYFHIDNAILFLYIDHIDTLPMITSTLFFRFLFCL